MLQKRKKIVLAISGNIAAGKNEAAEYLEKKYKAYAYRSSEVLRDILGRMYLPKTRENMQKVSTMIRNYFEEDIISYIASLDLKKIKNRLVAINGARRFSDLERLKKYFKIKLIYIDASPGNRYDRISKRSENSDERKKTFNEFKNDHKREAEKQIKSLRTKADFIIKNDGTLEEFYKKIGAVMKLINK